MKNEQIIIEQLDRIEQTIHDIKSKPLSHTEAAEYLGISESYLYKLTSQARVPHYKPGGKNNYYDKLELDKWIKRNRISTVEEIDLQAKRRVFSRTIEGRIGESR